MNYQGTINSVNKALLEYCFPPAEDFAEDFAIQRFHKKFQQPKKGMEESRRDTCVFESLSFDANLLSLNKWMNWGLTDNNYQRLLMVQSDFRKLFPESTIPHQELSFPPGSELEPTQGLNSVQRKLSDSKWQTTEANMFRFFELIKSHRGLRKALRERYYEKVATSNNFHSLVIPGHKTVHCIDMSNTSDLAYSWLLRKSVHVFAGKGDADNFISYLKMCGRLKVYRINEVSYSASMEVNSEGDRRVKSFMCEDGKIRRLTLRNYVKRVAKVPENRFSTHLNKFKEFIRIKKPFEIRKERREHGLWYMFQRTVEIVDSERCWSVPKNNEKDRGISLGPLGNLLTQKQVGSHIRSVMLKSLKIDLNSLADRHREKISDSSYATIDFSNASNSISRNLAYFVTSDAPGLNKALKETRCHYASYKNKKYELNRVASMGNGFCFEFMSILLTLVARTFDRDATVFGDDVIIKKDKALDFITFVESLGFNVNKDKTFVDGKFRESCGGNFLDDYGYIESYDFKWATNIGECISLHNKLWRLSKIYPSFKDLFSKVHRIIPNYLRGPVPKEFLLADTLSIFNGNSWRGGARGDKVDIPNFFITEGKCWGHSQVKHRNDGMSVTNKMVEDVSEYLSMIQLADKPRIGLNFKFIPVFRYMPAKLSASLEDIDSRWWAKGLMYLFDGRRSDDVDSRDSCGRWTFSMRAVSREGRIYTLPPKPPELK